MSQTYPQSPVRLSECKHLPTGSTGWLAPCRDQYIDTQHFNASRLAIHRSLDKSLLYCNVKVLNRGLSLLRHVLYHTAGPDFEGVQEVESTGDTALVLIERINKFFKYESHTYSNRARTYRKSMFLTSVKTELAFVPLETAHKHQTQFTPAVPLWYINLENVEFIWDMYDDLTVMAGIESNLLKIRTNERDPDEAYSFITLIIDPYLVLDVNTLDLRESKSDMTTVPL